MITSKELAKLAGVSQSTVSRALNDSPLISEGIRNKVKQLAKEHRFEMNSQAKSLRTSRTDTIGILFPKFFMNLSTNLYFTYLYDKLQEELSNYEYDLLIIYDSKKNDQLSPLEKIIKRKKVDGLILVKSDLSSYEQEILTRSTLPYISIFCNYYEDAGNSKYAINTYDGGFLAGSYFAKQQEYSPLYFGSLMDSADSSNRYKGFEAGWKASGGDVKTIHTVSCEMSITSAYQTVRDNIALFSEKRALYVYNDMMASGILHALKDMSIKVPEQVQIIGNDDIPLASWLHPQLSTLRFPTQQIIELGCQRLVREIVSGTREIENFHLSPELVLRGTTKE
jgi:DNA-binding LacI/PurR family transcriptional regulator